MYLYDARELRPVAHAYPVGSANERGDVAECGAAYPLQPRVTWDSAGCLDYCGGCAEEVSRLTFLDWSDAELRDAQHDDNARADALKAIAAEIHRRADFDPEY